MKVHQKPKNVKHLSAFPQTLVIDGDDWSYTTMGEKTYIRPPDCSATYEADYFEIAKRMPPPGPKVSPSAQEMEKYVREFVIPEQMTSASA